MGSTGPRRAVRAGAVGLALCACLGCSTIVGISDWEPRETASSASGGGPGADSCTDGRKSGDESDLDCGGACEPCPVGSSCASDADCAAEHCVGSVCCESACAGGCLACSMEQTGAPDGTCAPVPADTDPQEACRGGDTCDGAGLCRCMNGVKDGTEPFIDCFGPCLKPCSTTCMDGTKNNAETDIDCGGTTCPKCASGLACKIDGDCAAAVCAKGLCS